MTLSIHTPGMSAGQKAAATRRARLAGVIPAAILAKPAPVAGAVLTAGQKAAATRRANLAAATIVATIDPSAWIVDESPAPAKPSRARRAKVLADRGCDFDRPAPAVQTPGQKAAEFRRFHAKAREDAARLAAGIEEPSPVEDSRMVKLWTNSTRTGCGVRCFVVLEIGPQAVRLFDPSCNLVEITVDRLTFDRLAQPLAFRPSRVAARIEANVDQALRFKLRADLPAADAALRILGH